MAPARDKWVRRFIIPETTRHKRGFTIYKVTSVVFLKSSHEEVSKVSIWKRYNDFKKLHSELHALYSRSQINESFPTFPKSKFFGRFETEVIEERRECALKFLDFIGRHSYLYSSDIFIKFFETSHVPDCPTDCNQSLSSDTSEDDRHTYLNPASTDDIATRIILEQVSKTTESTSMNSYSKISVPAEINQGAEIAQKASIDSKDSNSRNVNDSSFKNNKMQMQEAKGIDRSVSITDNSFERAAPILQNDQSFCDENKDCDKSMKNNVTNGKRSTNVEAPNSNEEASSFNKGSMALVMANDGSDLPQCWPESSQYILIAAAHISAGFRHEALSEYEEAFTQYKMGIASLLIGVQCDSDKLRTEIIKDKISKYLQRAEKLYNRHLNCNISLLSKPVSELQYYKVLKIMKSVMLVKDVRQNCLRIVKAIEKSPVNQGNISNYILRGQVPHMVRLYACIETETTVFLILQHLSRGKLWDFVTSHYKSRDNGFCDAVNVENNIGNTFDIDIIGSTEDSTNSEVKRIPTFLGNSDLESTNFKVQTETCAAMEEQQEMYSAVTTTQLLEKAQILLRSVNETIKESNTVASRLYESNHLLNDQDGTVLLNIMNTTHQPENGNIELTDVVKSSTETNNINKTDIWQREASSLETMPNKGAIIDNTSSSNDVRDEESHNNTENSSLSDSCKDLSYCDKESVNSSIENLPTVCTHFSIEQKNHNRDEVTNTVDINKSLKTCQISTNSYERYDDQPHDVDTMLFTESTKNSTMDIERELWAVPENVVRLWAAEILLALEALHQQEVIVRDLKPENLLLDDNEHVQLTYIIPVHETDLSKHKQPYASPELCMFLPTVPLTPATDIWSFGVILYELIVGNTFQSRHPGVFHSHSTINIPNKLSRNAKSLLLNILKYQPNERMTIPEIKQHPFFEGLDWSSLVNPI